MNSPKILNFAFLAALSSGSSQAAITYVDAQAGVGGNTFATGGTQGDTDWVIPSTTSVNSNKWSQREFGTNSTIFQALFTGTPEGIPQLTTTISGLTDGATYRIWAFFQDNVGDMTSPFQNWVLAAGLDPALDTTYWAPDQPLAAHNDNPPALGTGGSGTITTVGVQEASTLNFVGSAPLFPDAVGTGERRLYAVNLGEVSLSGETTINVYVDMLIAGNGTFARTWYDGVGYELIPEPSTALLGIFALLPLLQRRRQA